MLAINNIFKKTYFFDVHLLVCYTSIPKDHAKRYVKALKLNFTAFAMYKVKGEDKLRVYLRRRYVMWGLWRYNSFLS